MRVISECRSCGSNKLREFLDLGGQYTSDFREDDSKPPMYPVNAIICEECMLVQLRHTTPSSVMYHDNYGFKSGVSDSIMDDLKSIVKEGLERREEAMSWLDIASNDGTLLSFVPDSIHRVGVDPVTFLCEEARQHADEIVNDFFPTDKLAPQKFDVITSISCFYDMDDPNAFVKGVADRMDDDSVWIIQQNYLLPTLELNAVDNFCHEHLEYYTLLSIEPLLKRHGLQVSAVSTSMVNGGSIRTVVTKENTYIVEGSVAWQRDIEKRAGIHTFEPYERFARDVGNGLRELKLMVKDLVEDGKTVYILAASTRGSTIWQAAGFDNELIDYAVERNPNKVGRYFSAIGVPIISEEEARERKPDYMICGPWFFAFPEIVRREGAYIMGGGAIILPLPKVEIIDAGNISTYLQKSA